MPVLDVSGAATSPAAWARDVWQSRQLVATLARREFFAKYRRAALGVVWAVALPLLQALVLAVVFTRVARLDLPGNAFVFVFSGMAAWSYYSTAVTAGATAIVDNSQLASKIYFPRVALPLVAVVSNGYLAVVNVALLLVATFASGARPGVDVLWLVPAAVLLVATTTVTAALLGGLHVYFRDVRYLVQAVLLLAFYLTPVFYPLDPAPAALRAVVRVNPVTGVVELYRAGTVGADSTWPADALIATAWVVVLGVAAVVLHCRRDRVFTDLL